MRILVPSFFHYQSQSEWATFALEENHFDARFDVFSAFNRMLSMHALMLFKRMPACS
jgi:hypothetical protein